jgi:hypothetical protein
MNPLNYMRLHDYSSRNPRQHWINASNGKIRDEFHVDQNSISLTNSNINPKPGSLGPLTDGTTSYTFTVNDPQQMALLTFNGKHPGGQEKCEAVILPEIKTPSSPASLDLIVCTGTICKDGDWEVRKNPNSPVPGLGDCTSERVLYMLDLKREVREIRSTIVGPVEGDAKIFHVTKADRHQTYLDSGGTYQPVARNIALCGYADAGDARARLRIEAFYK